MNNPMTMNNNLQYFNFDKSIIKGSETSATTQA